MMVDTLVQVKGGNVGCSNATPYSLRWSLWNGDLKSLKKAWRWEERRSERVVLSSGDIVGGMSRLVSFPNLPWSPLVLFLTKRVTHTTHFTSCLPVLSCVLLVFFLFLCLHRSKDGDKLTMLCLTDGRGESSFTCSPLFFWSYNSLQLKSSHSSLQTAFILLSLRVVTRVLFWVAKIPSPTARVEAKRIGRKSWERERVKTPAHQADSLFILGLRRDSHWCDFFLSWCLRLDDLSLSFVLDFLEDCVKTWRYKTFCDSLWECVSDSWRKRKNRWTTKKSKRKSTGKPTQTKLKVMLMLTFPSKVSFSSSSSILLRLPVIFHSNNFQSTPTTSPSSSSLSCRAFSSLSSTTTQTTGFNVAFSGPPSKQRIENCLFLPSTG